MERKNLKMNINYFLISIFLLLNSCSTNISSNNTNGAISSTSRLASEVGIDILKRGGNAFDAIVATGFTLAVTSPANGNIGGGGFLVAQTENGEVFSLDFREEAPAQAYETMFLDENNEYSRDLALLSHKSSGVPGTVDGLITIFNDYGSGEFTLEEILAPAINYAENGHGINKSSAFGFDWYRHLFIEDEAASKIFIKNLTSDMEKLRLDFTNGIIPKDEYIEKMRSFNQWLEGDILFQKDLAKTLKLIAQNGASGFYSGEVADLIVAEMKENNGLITKEDLLNYKSVYRDPVVGTYRGKKIVSMGPPSSGGALLVQMLNMLENYEVKSIERNSTQFVHMMTEIQRLAYADRSIHLGDPDFWPNPIPMLTSKEYAKERLELISMNKATPSTDIAAGKAPVKESMETTHYSAMDKAGNIVGITTTINHSYGNKKIVDGAGFLLNNEMDDFSSKPGQQNTYGLIGYSANSIQPSKRPLSSMTPTLIIDEEGNPIMTIGAAGGSRIITAVLQTIISVIDHNLGIQEAIDLPRTHSQWLPDVIRYEPRALNKKQKEELTKLNHMFDHNGNVESGMYYLARAHGIHFKNGTFSTGVDTRGNGEKSDGATY